MIDVSNPASPLTVGILPINFCEDVAVAGSYAYVIVQNTALVVVSVSNPASPVIVGSVGGLPAMPERVVVAGTYAYIADGSAGLVVVDVATPTSPMIVGSVNTPGSARDVAVGATHAYVADGTSGLAVVDISNPASPVIVGSVDTPGNVSSVGINATHAYVADNAEYENRLRVVSISNPALPVIVGSLAMPSSALDVTVAGDFAYVGSADLVAVDISPLAIVGSGGIPYGPAHRVAVSGDHVYVAAYDSDFVILPAHCPAQSAVPLPEGGPITVSRLAQNRPNPFGSASGATEIRFALPGATRARLEMFNAAGRPVRLLVDAVLEAGEHAAWWDGRNDRGEAVGSGVYFYRLQAGEFSATQALVRLK